MDGEKKRWPKRKEKPPKKERRDKIFFRSETPAFQRAGVFLSKI